MDIDLLTQSDCDVQFVVLIVRVVSRHVVEQE